MFLLGKFVGLFLHPFLWIVAIIVIALFTKDSFRKRRRLILAGILALFFSIPLIIDRLCLAWQPEQREFAPGENYETGILLGGFSGFDKVENKPYFNGNSDRFLETYRLYKTGHIRKILITGANGSGNDDEFVESDFAHAKLLELGVPETDIITERRSRNTIENAAFTKRLLDSAQFSGRQVIITSAMHMRRASMIFQKAGIDVRPYACAYMIIPQDGRIRLEAFVPDPFSFNLWDMYLRERVGHVVAFLK